jgi:hypothetical protein
LNRHWQTFIEEIPWFLGRSQVASVGEARPPGTWSPESSVFGKVFPELDQLLRRASPSSVEIDRARYQLLTWIRGDGGTCSWLSPFPSTDPMPAVCSDHQILLRSFGGIVERSNEPEWWVLNHNNVLTERAAGRDGTFIRQYDSAFEDAGVQIPIDLERVYAIAVEANGNTTFCDRLSGEVVLFAPDHAFDHVELFPGCPEMTLYRLDGALDFRNWVNTIVRQWCAWTNAAD